jgi:alanyl-tRNA synthetase
MGSTYQGSIVEKVESLIENLDTERKRSLTLERELSRRIAESLMSKVETVNGIKVLSARISSSRIEMLREMSDLLRERLESGIIVLGTVYEDKPLFLAAVTEDLTAKGFNAGDAVKRAATVAGGGGGGKATLAQAGGKNKDKLDEALREAVKYVQEKQQ